MSEPTPKPKYEAAPTCYASVLGKLRERAREIGYALAIHGSMQRDFDVVAVPWIEEAAAPDVLVELIRKTVGGFLVEQRDGRDPASKPHGRLAWSIHLGGGPYIDLSIMPRALPAVEPLRQGLDTLYRWLSQIPCDESGCFAVGDKRFSLTTMLDEVDCALCRHALLEKPAG